MFKKKQNKLFKYPFPFLLTFLNCLHSHLNGLSGSFLMLLKPQWFLHNSWHLFYAHSFFDMFSTILIKLRNLICEAVSF